MWLFVVEVIAFVGIMVPVVMGVTVMAVRFVNILFALEKYDT